MIQYFYTGIWILFGIMITACDFSRNANAELNQNIHIQTFADSLWLEFAQALESKNIEYLVQNSLDTIQCAECQLLINVESEFYEANFLFENHINKLAHLPSFKDRVFSTFQNDNLINVNYKIKCKKCEYGAYNLIFTFVKIKEEYLFKGMIAT